MAPSRSPTTPPAATTPPPVRVRFFLIQAAPTIQPPDFRRSLAMTPATSTRPTVLSRCSATSAGGDNVDTGRQALNHNITDGSNVALGDSTLFNNTAGHDNLEFRFKAQLHKT